MTDDDKKLSEKIIRTADALQNWDLVKPYAKEVTSLVKEYSEVIDGAKDTTAEQQAMVEQITQAVGGMITRATAEITNHMSAIEDREAITRAKAIQQGFRSNVRAHAKTFPITGSDTLPLDLLIHDATEVIELLYTLIGVRSAEGDGRAIMVLYRNLHAVVQCKLTMNQWRHDLTREVLEEADEQIVRLIQVWVPVVHGFQRMEGLSFSQGIIHFHVGGGRTPEYNKYSYHYRSKEQPVRGSDRAAVAKSFVEARKAARKNAVPQGLIEWNNYPYKQRQQILKLKEQMLQ
ncbi:hypothetical protein BJX65DRAFT_315314 [Aspergillus insuetus]